MKTKEHYFEEIASYKLLAKKEVGQNFLIDCDVARQIVEALDIQPGEKVLEIGCGAGSLTYFLAQSEGQIDAIDIDEAMIAKISGDFESEKNVHCFQANAMRFDYSSYDKIIGNLPYYITSGIFEQVLLGAMKANTAIFMIQKEAADRLLSKPRTEDYSALNVFLSLSGDTERLFRVSRDCFAPAPHVDSSVLRIQFAKSHNEEAISAYHWAKRLFLKRRKTLVNNLRANGFTPEECEAILSDNSIPMSARPEELTPSQYLALSQTILSMKR